MCTRLKCSEKYIEAEKWIEFTNWPLTVLYIPYPRKKSDFFGPVVSIFDVIFPNWSTNDPLLEAAIDGDLEECAGDWP